MTTKPPSTIKEQVYLFFTALMFFTRIPIPGWVPFSTDYLNRSSRYFPLVGVVVGGIGAAVFWLANLVWPVSIAVLLSMVATIVVTGAFHEDGLADSCDGFGGGYTPERVLEIMKDSRIGTFGAVGIGLALAMKFLALTSLDAAILPWAIIAGHSVSRFASAMLIYTLSYARSDDLSKSKPLSTKLSTIDLIVAGVCGLLPLVLLPWQFWLALLPAAIVTALAGRYFVKRIGGYTGDCLGATQQLTEVTFYLFGGII